MNFTENDCCQIPKAYEPGAVRGVRWDDPLTGIRRPRGVRTVSEQDAGCHAPRVVEHAVVSLRGRQEIRA